MLKSIFGFKGLSKVAYKTCLCFGEFPDLKTGRVVVQNELIRLKKTFISSKLRLFVFFALFLAFCCDLYANNSNEKLEYEPVRVIVLADFPQLYMVDPRGKPIGFAIDVFEQVAAIADLKFRYVIVGTWADALDAIRDGRGDVIPGIGVSAEREAEFLYINEREEAPISCFVLSDNTDIKGIEDCKVLSKKIAAIDNSSAMNTLKADRDYHLVSFKSMDAGLKSLLVGAVDAFVFPEPAMRKKLHSMGIEDRIKTVGQPLQILKRAYLMKKGNTALAERLDGPLHEVVGSAQYSELYLKWYGKPEVFWTVKRGLVFVSGIFAVGILFFMLWKAVYTAKVNRLLVKNQKLLKESEENYKTTLISIGDAVMATDTDMKITQMNPMAEKLTGWTVEDARSVHVEDVFNIIDLEKNETAVNPVKRVLECGEMVGLSNHTVLISRDGHEFHIADSASPIRDEQQNITGVVLVFRDVTEEYTMREKMQQSQKLDAIGQLAGGVAHDFNNMLGGIIGGAELLQINLPEDNTKCHEYLSMILESASRAADLAQNLLLFARRETPSSTAIDVHQAVRTAIALLEKTIDKRIEIEFDLNAAHSMVVGDDSQLQGAFLNLGINASHAMPDGGKLIYSSRQVYIDGVSGSSSTFGLKEGNYLQIEVRDTGTGIDKSDMERIFEPFFTTKEQGKGTGLGLAAVYGTVQQHGGSITVYSELGEGTKFTILLPVAENAIAEPPQKFTAAHGHGTILLVDDEAVMRAAGRAMLNNFGYTVHLAENGQEALDIFNKCKGEVDLVVLDMIMPVMNGRDCFFELRKIDQDIPIILASGFSPSDDLKDIKAKGLSGFVQKPFRAAELSQIVSKALELDVAA